MPKKKTIQRQEPGQIAMSEHCKTCSLFVSYSCPFIVIAFFFFFFQKLNECTRTYMRLCVCGLVNV